MKIDFAKHGPIISEKETGEEIYLEIKKSLTVNGSKIEIDMSKTKTMATYCAKQIFGRLYLELGAEFFFERIILTNASNELKLIIKMGIQNALEELEEA
ncbi:MAG: STAS-like domain-containing protein [Flavobacterium sp.]|nr:STAS-like domain-containing protein [Flavobacterium sp.]